MNDYDWQVIFFPGNLRIQNYLTKGVDKLVSFSHLLLFSVHHTGLVKLNKIGVQCFVIIIPFNFSLTSLL